MGAIKQRLAAFQESRPGLFVKKVSDDQATNLGALLAWGTLSTLLPLLLGLLAIAGLVLRDPERLNQLYSSLVGLVPTAGRDVLGQALESVRTGGAGGAGIVGIALLLFNGSRFFSNMTGVFNKAYHVEGRNIVVQTLVSVVMLFVVSALMIVSTLAFGIGNLMGTFADQLPFGGVFGRLISWTISLASAFLLFVLLYKVLPNVKQGWRNVLPGAGLASVALLLITALFPLYLTFFPPNEAYATFGLFLVFTFWLYLLGLIFVVGAELNSFLLQPARSSAIAEATANAEQGKVAMQQQGGQVAAQAMGDAPSMGGADERPVTADPSKTDPKDASTKDPTPSPSPQPTYAASATPSPSSARVGADPAAQAPLIGPRPVPAHDRKQIGVGGRIVGFLGVIAAAIMVRKESSQRRQTART